MEISDPNGYECFTYNQQQMLIHQTNEFEVEYTGNRNGPEGLVEAYVNTGYQVVNIASAWLPDCGALSAYAQTEYKENVAAYPVEQPTSSLVTAADRCRSRRTLAAPDLWRGQTGCR